MKEILHALDILPLENLNFYNSPKTYTYQISEFLVNFTNELYNLDLNDQFMTDIISFKDVSFDQMDKLQIIRNIYSKNPNLFKKMNIDLVEKIDQLIDLINLVKSSFAVVNNTLPSETENLSHTQNIVSLESFIPESNKRKFSSEKEEGIYQKKNKLNVIIPNNLHEDVFSYQSSKSNVQREFENETVQKPSDIDKTNFMLPNDPLTIHSSTTDYNPFNSGFEVNSPFSMSAFSSASASITTQAIPGLNTDINESIQQKEQINFGSVETKQPSLENETFQLPFDIDWEENLVLPDDLLTAFSANPDSNPFDSGFEVNSTLSFPSTSSAFASTTTQTIPASDLDQTYQSHTQLNTTLSLPLSGANLDLLRDESKLSISLNPAIQKQKVNIRNNLKNLTDISQPAQQKMYTLFGRETKQSSSNPTKLESISEAALNDSILEKNKPIQTICSPDIQLKTFFKKNKTLPINNQLNILLNKSQVFSEKPITPTIKSLEIIERNLKKNPLSLNKNDLEYYIKNHSIGPQYAIKKILEVETLGFVDILDSIKYKETPVLTWFLTNSIEQVKNFKIILNSNLSDQIKMHYVIKNIDAKIFNLLSIQSAIPKRFFKTIRDSIVYELTPPLNFSLKKI